ncbi:hypothetical protein BRC60_09065 [Halobacteriales archaeon QH_1_68_42]|nr:MAG: hypothetical protein BRC60_09065 [Halobacteriales archaeon QH_1_68_42]
MKHRFGVVDPQDHREFAPVALTVDPLGAERLRLQRERDPPRIVGVEEVRRPLRASGTFSTYESDESARSNRAVSGVSTPSTVADPSPIPSNRVGVRSTSPTAGPEMTGSVTMTATAAYSSARDRFIGG